MKHISRRSKGSLSFIRVFQLAYVSIAEAVSIAASIAEAAARDGVAAEDSAFMGTVNARGWR
jgi:hypothetical protein